jgi:hypothetical protein
MSARSDALARPLATRAAVVAAIVAGQYIVARWLAEWDAGAHLLALRRGHVSSVVVIGAGLALRLFTYVILPPLAAWWFGGTIVRNRRW